MLAVLACLVFAWLPQPGGQPGTQSGGQSSAPPSQLRHETWPDGKPRAEYEVVVDAQGNEIRSGSYRTWHESGALASEGVFAGDKETGRWTFFHPDGQKAEEGSFARGERTGPWASFHPDGTHAARGKYDKGQRTGAWQFWLANGKEDKENSGTYEYVAYHASDGRLALAGYRLDGQRHGTWTSTWPDLEPELSGSYARGKRTGEWIFHHPDGGISTTFSGHYEDGQRSGPAVIEPGATAARRGAPAIEDSPLGVPRDANAIQTELEVWIGADARRVEAALREIAQRKWSASWLTAGTRALPILLRRLVFCDPTSASGRAAMGRIEALALRPLCGGEALGPPNGPANEADARELVRAWTSLWSALRDDVWFFEVELRLARSGSPLGEPPFHDWLAGASDFHPPECFARRFEKHPTTPGTAAVDSALDWLASSQFDDGHWGSELLPDGKGGTRASGGQRGYDVGVTGLGALALLGNGETPGSGAHARTLTRALVWLLAHQASDDGRFQSVFTDPESNQPNRIHNDWLYEHAIATLALSEALAFHPSEPLRVRAQRAVDLLFLAHNPYSGWRYAVPATGDNDSSVTAWAVTALATAERAGLTGDFSAAYDGAKAFLDEMTDPESGRVGYTEMGSSSARNKLNADFEREKGEPLTAAALYCRWLVGQRPDTEPMINKHVRLLCARLPIWDPAVKGFDEYYYYYGSEALALVGGKAFETWTKAQNSIVSGQCAKMPERGSWDPIGVWACCGGRVYSTAMLALGLEAPFRMTLSDPVAPKKRKK